MRIAIAQIKSFQDSIEKNIKTHVELISKAATKNVQLIFFPELSIHSYAPSLAEQVALLKNDSQFDIFQELCDRNGMVIIVGAAIRVKTEIEISSVIFEPKKERRTYSKQILHEDEKEFFVGGNHQEIIHCSDTQLAPAICYEALDEKHLKFAIEKGAQIYLASVAKAEQSMIPAFDYFSSMSKKHKIPILMSNTIGYCESFIGAGQSSVWNKNGELKERMGKEEQGFIIYDFIHDLAVIETY